MYRFLHTIGSCFEQGMMHGKKLDADIANNLDLYFYRFEHECQLEKDEVLRRAQLYLPHIQQQNPEYFAGMQGIAKGCNADLIEIAALNVRYEILYYQYALKGLADGCTSLAIMGERSSDGCTILAQNWDWFPNTAVAIIQADHANGISSLAFTEAGIFGGKIGFNSAGIGLLINGLIALQDDWTTMHKPFHLRCFEILQQKTLQDAIAVVTDESRACSANFVIGSSEGKVFNVEAAPQTFAVQTPKNGILIHTNHFLDPGAVDVSEPADERIHTEHRYKRAVDLANQTDKPISEAQIKTWLSDHDGYPHSICQHRDPELHDYDQYESVASFVINLTNRSMSISHGPPCSSEFQSYRLKSEYCYV